VHAKEDDHHAVEAGPGASTLFYFILFAFFTAGDDESVITMSVIVDSSVFSIFMSRITKARQYTLLKGRVYRYNLYCPPT
jgi:hypothetical protein